MVVVFFFSQTKTYSSIACSGTGHDALLLEREESRPSRCAAWPRGRAERVMPLPSAAGDLGSPLASSASLPSADRTLIAA